MEKCIYHTQFVQDAGITPLKYCNVIHEVPLPRSEFLRFHSFMY